MANRPWDSKRAAFVEALKKLRTAHGLTQTELAKLVGKPQSYVSKYESGERKLDFVEVLEICKALKTKPEVLINVYENLL